MTHRTVIQELRRAKNIRQALLIGEPGLIGALEGRQPDIPPISHLNNGYLGELRRQSPKLADEARELIHYITGGKERG